MSADYNEVRDLIMIGGYAKGSMPEVDEAIRYKPLMDNYLQQDMYENATFYDSKVALLSMFCSDAEIEHEMKGDDNKISSKVSSLTENNIMRNKASEETEIIL